MGRTLRIVQTMMPPSPKIFFRHSHPARSWFTENDVFVVDRGFRDAVDILEEAGFHVKMPCYLPKGAIQNSYCGSQHVTPDY